MAQKEYLVIWDGYGLENRGTGIYRYAQNMAQELVGQGITPVVLWDTLPVHRLHAQLEYQIVSSPVCFSRIRRLKALWPQIISRHLNKNFVSTGKKVVFHGLSNFNVPLSRRFQKNFSSVITVHDMIPYLAKKSVSLSYYLQFIHILPRVLHAVDHIVCVSEWTRSVLNQYFGGFESKITVIPHGFNSFTFKGRVGTKNDSMRIRLLYIARLEKYKRIEFLLEIVKKSKGKFSLDLVTDLRGSKLLSRDYSELIRSGLVRFWTGLSDEEMKNLFFSTDVYVHPSLYEGYGLPVAEAISFGLPVVFQSGSAIDEVVGPDGGFPMHGTSRSIEDWIDRILEAYNEAKAPDFSSRMQNICERRGGWAESARTLISIYDNLGL